jgi:hypothetical protein
VRIIAIGTGAVGRELADRLGLPYLDRVDEVSTEGFVLDGSHMVVPEARALDAVLRARACEIDAVLWAAGGDPGILEHYYGRVVSLDAGEALESALAGLREILLAA